MRDTYKQYTINGRKLYAHSPKEAFDKYKEKYIVDNGAILHINRKWYRVFGEKIVEILKRK